MMCFVYCSSKCAKSPIGAKLNIETALVLASTLFGRTKHQCNTHTRDSHENYLWIYGAPMLNLLTDSGDIGQR